MCAPQMIERKEGSIIIVSSIGGLRGSPSSAPTASPRPPISSWRATWRVEYGPHNVRVNCIAPGLVRTDFARALWENPEMLERATRTAPLRRIGEPDEIAGAAVYLASRASSLHDRPGHRLRRRRHHLTQEDSHDSAPPTDLEDLPARNPRLAGGQLPARDAPAARATEADICWGGRKRFKFQSEAQRLWFERMAERLDRAGLAARIWRRRPVDHAQAAILRAGDARR